MKVIHLIPALEQGGVETVVCNLNRVLVVAGWESVVISCGGRLVSKIEADGGRHIEMDLKSKNPFTYFIRAYQLRRLMRVEKPDLVCVHSRVPAWLFVWANRALGLRWITYAHGANSVSVYSEVMTRGNITIVPSKFLADYLKKNYGVNDDRIRIIPNAVDFGRFDPNRLDSVFIAEKRREWGIETGNRVVMSIGRISPVKGFDNVIRTMSGPNTKLIIVGGADRDKQRYFDYLKSIAGENVIFAGAQSKIPECISIADEIIIGNTTKPESFGLSVVEAYAMNRPVSLLRHFGGAAEIVDAVASCRAESLRSAAFSLYNFDIMSQKTLTAYNDTLQ